MAEQIASGEIRISVDDEASAQLRRIEAEYEKMLRDIDRSEAEIDIKVDLEGLKKSLKEAKAQIEKSEKKVEEAASDRSRRRHAKALREAKAEKEALESQLASVKDLVAARKLENKVAEITDKRLTAVAKREEARAKVLAAADKQRLAAQRATENHTRRVATDEEKSMIRRAANARQEATLELRRRREEEMTAQRRAQNGRQEEVMALRRATAARQEAVLELRRQRAAEASALRLAAARRQDIRLELTLQNARETKERRIARERERDQRLYEKHMKQEARDRELALAAQEREIQAIPKMQRRYLELLGTLERLNDARRKARGDVAATMLVDVKEREAIEEMERLKAVLQRLGETDPIEIDVRLERASEAGIALRHWLAQNQGNAFVMGAALGQLAGRGFRKRFNEVTSRGLHDTMRGGLSSAADAGARGLRSLGTALLRWSSGLASMTVRLGPFTASVRQAIGIIALMAPILLDVVGAMGAFIGAAGSATLGVGALATAAIGGAIPVFGGLGLVISDVASEFSAVMKAQKAYDDAVRKGNSDLAEKKLKELRATMGNVSKDTVDQIGLAQKLGASWRAATADARTEVWTTIGEALETANAMLPMFARNTNSAMKVAGDAVRGWLRGLRSDEGQDIISTMMTNFTAMLGPVLRGLGSVATYLGRVGRLASDYLPGIGRTFEEWAQRLEDSSENTEGLRDKIDKVITSAKNMGNLFLAAGRLVKTFFGGGVDSGDTLVVTMTNAFNRWNSFLQSAEGREDLRKFFEGGVKGAQALYSFLAPILTTFVRWAELLAPVARGVAGVAGAVTDFAAAIMEITVLATPLTALLTTLGAIWAVSRIHRAASAVADFTKALLGMSRAQRSVAAGAAAMEAADALDGPDVDVGRRRRKGPKGGPGVGVLDDIGDAASRNGKKVGIFRTLLNSLGGTAGRTAMKMSGVTAAIGGLGLIIAQGGTTMGTFHQDALKLNAAGKEAANSYRGLVAAGYEVGTTHQQNMIVLRQMREALDDTKEGTDEHKQALLDYNTAWTIANQSGEKWRSLQKTLAADLRQSADAQLRAAQQDIVTHRTVNKERIAALEERLRIEANPARRNQIIDQLTMLSAKERELGEAAERAGNRQAAVASNVSRIWRNMLPILGEAEQRLGALARTRPNLAQKIALRFESPKDVGRIAATVTQALKRGIPVQRIRAILDDKDARNDLRQLERLMTDYEGRNPETKLRLDPKDANGKLVSMLRNFGDYEQENPETDLRADSDHARDAVDSLLNNKFPAYEKSNPTTALRVSNEATKATDKIMADLRAAASKPIQVALKLSLAGGTFNARGDGWGVEESVTDYVQANGNKALEAAGGLGAGPISGTGLNAFNGIATMMGLQIGSGFRAGSITSSGNLSYHAMGRARDFPGPPGRMMAFARFLAATYGSRLKELIYTPLGFSIKNGQRVAPYAQAQHYDHVHVAMRQGGEWKGSQKITKPQILAGEESPAHPEFFISTNPRDRKRSAQLLTEAAKRLNLEHVAWDEAYARGGARFGSFGGKKTAAAPGKKVRPEFKPKATLAPPMYNKKGKPKTHKGLEDKAGKLGKLSVRRDYQSYLEGLITQQGYWEREVSIRESLVREPEDWIIQSGERLVKDPTTGQNVAIPNYVANEGPIKEYKAQLASVIDAMNTLLRIIAEIVRIVPAVQNAVRAERTTRESRVEFLNDAIDKERKRPIGKDKKGREKRQEAKERRIDKLTKERDEHKGIADELREYEGTLVETRVDAGFDYRETKIAQDKYKEDLAESKTRGFTEGHLANIAEAEKVTGVGSGGGPGPGPTPDTPDPSDPGGVNIGSGVATAQAAAESMQALRDFGQNFLTPDNIAISQVGAAAGVTPGARSAGSWQALDPGAAGAALRSGAGAATALRSVGRAQPSAAPVAAAPAGGDKNITFNQTFIQQPDPHTFVKGVEFEINHAI